MRVTRPQGGNGGNCKYCGTPLLKTGQCCSGECVAEEECEDLRAEVERLREAIEDHRAEVAADGHEPMKRDRRLYAALDERKET